MKSYKLVPVDVKPEKEGWYFVWNRYGGDYVYYKNKYKWGKHGDYITHYLLPVSEEEHREEMFEVWKAGFQGYPDFDTFYNNKYKPE
jgi:hypothetical protein